MSVVGMRACFVPRVYRRGFLRPDGDLLREGGAVPGVPFKKRFLITKCLLWVLNARCAPKNCFLEESLGKTANHNYIKEGLKGIKSRVHVNSISIYQILTVSSLPWVTQRAIHDLQGNRVINELKQNWQKCHSG